MSGTHENYREHATPEGGSNRAFGLVLFAALLLLAFFPLSSTVVPMGLAFAAAAILGFFAIVAPSRLSPLNRAWTRLGLALSRIASPVMLGIIYYLAVTPTGIVMRLAGKDLLKRKIDRTADTYWVDRTPAGPDAESLKNQY